MMVDENLMSIAAVTGREAEEGLSQPSIKKVLDYIKRFRIRSFKTRIGVTCALLITALLLIFGIVSLRLFASSLNNEAVRYTAIVLEQSRMHIDTYMHQIKTSLEIISRSSIVIDNVRKYRESEDVVEKIEARKEIVRIIEDTKKQMEDINNISIYIDRDSYFNARTKALNSNHEFVRNVWERKLNEKSLRVEFFSSHLSDYYYEWTQSDLKNVISVIGPIRDLRGGDSFSGVNLALAVYDFDIRGIEEILRNVRLEKTGYILIIDEKNLCVFHPNQEYISTYIDESNFAGINDAQSGFYKTSINDVKSLVVFDTLNTTGWKVVSVIPLKEIAAHSAHQKIIISLLILFGILVSAFVSGKLATRMAQPLTRLVAHMRELQEGDFAVRASGENQDEEIIALNTGFNQMVKRMDGLIKDVYKIKIEQRQAEYQALQSKINPHFLNNTLQTISSLAILRRNREIEAVVSSLSDLMEYSIYEQNEMVKVLEELEYIENYIAIQNYKYGNSLHCRIEMGEELREGYIFKFMLQPVIENSIIHGFAEKEGFKEIIIQAVREANILHFTITDNGMGIAPKYLRKLSLMLNNKARLVDEKSIGLRNIQNRIKLKFGDNFGLKILSQEGKYTTIDIKIPYAKYRV